MVPTIIGLNLPDCPTGTDTQTSLFISDRDVRWYINNLAAIDASVVTQTGEDPSLGFHQGFWENSLVRIN